jgi:hypothetical protein
MANDVVTNTFVSGNLIKSSEVNTNFDDVVFEPLQYLGSAQNYFELLKHAGDVDNEDYLIADIFTDSDGVKDTINTTDTSAEYDATNDCYNIELSGASGTLHDPNSFTNPSNGFDNDDATYAEYTGGIGVLGKTFTSKYISSVKVKASSSLTGTTSTAVGFRLEQYNGSTWSTVKTWDSGVTVGILTADETVVINDTIQGLRINYFENQSGYPTSKKLYLLQYEYNSTDDVETNTLITLDGTEIGLIIFDKSEKPTDTSINVDVSDGTTTLSAQSVRSYIDISSLSSGNLSLDFNLNTTDTTVTPSLYGYGLVIVK